MTSSRLVLRHCFAILSVALGIVLITAACGGSSSKAQSSSGKSAQVSEKEWSITVSGTTLSKGQGNASVPTGTVTFDIKNDGAVAHALEIQGNGVDQKTADIDPGKSATLKVDLKAGKYEVWCPVSGHKQLGMDGSVTAS